VYLLPRYDTEQSGELQYFDTLNPSFDGSHNQSFFFCNSLDTEIVIIDVATMRDPLVGPI
jgi:hypothetical protein